MHLESASEAFSDGLFDPPDTSSSPDTLSQPFPTGHLSVIVLSRGA